MSNDAEVVLRARDLTREAFQQVQKALGELEAKAKDTGAQTKTMGDQVKGFFTAHATSFAAIGTVAAGALAGVVALASGIAALAVRGADVADIRGSFDALNRTIGNESPKVLATLRASFAGTVSDFNLMQMTNTALTQGLKGSAADFGLLADASRVLADRTGGDATQAFGMLSQAMATGKTKGAELLIGTIENSKSYEQYAASIGKAKKDLTEHEAAVATQIAIQARLKEIVDLNGKAVFDAADAWAASKVFVDNFKDSLAETIATSPVLGAALNGIRDGLMQSFGVDQQAQIRTLSSLVSSFAIGLASTAQVAITGAGVIVSAWNALQVVFSGTMSVVFSVGLAISTVVTKALELAATIPGVGSQFAGMAATARETTTVLGGMQQSFHDQAAEAWEGVKGNSALHDTLGSINTRIGAVKASMIAASGATGEATTTSKAATVAVGQLGGSFDGAGTSASTFAKHLREVKTAQDAMVNKTTDNIGFGLTSTTFGAGQMVAERLKGQQLMDKEPLKVKWDFSSFAPSVQRELGNVAPMVEPALAPAAEVTTRTMSGSLGDGIKGGFASIGPSLIAAFQGGGDALKSIGSSFGSSIMGSMFGDKSKLGGFVTKHLGDTLGGAFNALMPGIGALMGPLLGKISSMFKGVFGASQAELDGRKVSDAFRTSVDSIATDAQRASAATQGIAVSQVALADAFHATGRSHEESNRLYLAMAQAEKKGPEAVKKVVEEINVVLREAKGLQADMAAESAAQAGALSKYGLDFDAQTNSLVKDFQLLSASGIDNMTIVQSMSGAIKTYVEHMEAMGQSIPDSMAEVVAAWRTLGDTTLSTEGSAKSAGQTIGEAARAASAASLLAAQSAGDGSVNVMDKIAAKAAATAKSAFQTWASMAGVTAGGRSGGGSSSGDESEEPLQWQAGQGIWDFVQANGIGDITRFGSSYANAEDNARAQNEAANWIKDHPGLVEEAQRQNREAGGNGGRPPMGFFDGGIVNAPMSGQIVEVHGREAIVPTDRASAIGAQIAAANGARGASGRPDDERMASIERAVERLVSSMATFQATLLLTSRDNALLAGTRR